MSLRTATGVAIAGASLSLLTSAVWLLRIDFLSELLYGGHNYIRWGHLLDTVSEACLIVFFVALIRRQR